MPPDCAFSGSASASASSLDPEGAVVFITIATLPDPLD